MGYVWSGLYVLIGVLQIACAVHAVRNHRAYYWLGIILFFPLAGSLVYVIVEVMPDIREGRLGADLAAVIPQATRRQIARLEDQVQFSDTVENRLRLADAYMAGRQFDRAIHVYKRCLNGIYENDPHTLRKLAEAHFRNNGFGDAIGILASMKSLGLKENRDDRDLIEAQAYEGCGERAKAVEIYRELLNRYPGEEVRFRLARCINASGSRDRARELLAEILANARRCNHHYRRLNRKWIRLAKAAMSGSWETE